MKAKKVTSLVLSAAMVAGMTTGMATTVMADDEQVLKLAVVETAYRNPYLQFPMRLQSSGNEIPWEAPTDFRKTLNFL